MKRFLVWALRIVCFAIIGAALYTLIGCLLHINDDHSAAAIMGSGTTGSFASHTVLPESEENAVDSTAEVDENPTVTVYADGKATINRPYCTVTAAFGDIVNSIVANLSWYLDGELVEQEMNRLLVEGSTVSAKIKLDMENAQEDTARVTLEISFDQKSLTEELELELDLPEEDEVVIKTTEIPVTVRKSCSVYQDAELESKVDTLKKGDTALLLSYESDNGGLRSIEVLLGDGTSGWVDADYVEISQEDCTTEEDYTQEDKENFVNSMGYDSQTSYLVWVSLYTQRVNVFTGYQGNWSLEESFSCSTGLNTSPTTTGVFQYYNHKERWDLGTTYVEPVLIFNGGEAFTSQPYDTDTGEIVDDTMGEPASGGSVRMKKADIAWMEENLPQGSLVVVY